MRGVKKYTTLTYWLPKIPLLSLIGIFILPLALMELHQKTGLFFIALYISYWTVKVFESYYYVLRSYLRLLRIEKCDFREDATVRRVGKNLKHIVIIPIYTEPYDVIEENILAILANDYVYRESITILLATESRAPDAESHARKIIETYGNNEIRIVNIVHPADIE